MNRADSTVDRGRTFDWGNASADYARFRDIYPPQFLAGEALIVQLDITRERIIFMRNAC